MLKIINNNFENEVLNNEKATLVDFYADWCGPCKMIAPVLEKVASANDKFDIAKVNVDKEENIASKYNVFSIPTLVVIKDGEEKERLVGFRSEEEIIEVMNKYL